MEKYTKKLIPIKLKPKIFKYDNYRFLTRMSSIVHKSGATLNPMPKRTFTSMSDSNNWSIGDKIVHSTTRALKGKEIYDNELTWEKNKF